MRVALTLLIAIMLSVASITTAQEDPALVLAKGCVAEIGLEGKPDECVLMWSILLAKTDLYGLPRLVKRYNSLFRRKSSPRAWVLGLRSDYIRPVGWPQTARWEKWRTKWSVIYYFATEFLKSPPTHPCGSANHYGGAMDTVPHCWRRQWCGRAPQYFAQQYWQARTCTLNATIASGR